MMSVSGGRRRQFRRRGHVFGWGGGGFADKRRRSGRARIGTRSLALLQPAPPPPARGAVPCKQRKQPGEERQHPDDTARSKPHKGEPRVTHTTRAVPNAKKGRA